MRLAVFDLRARASVADETAWFSQANLTTSSWTDLKTAPAVNYFSVSGDGGARRNFFVNQLYAGCPGDVGWFVVSSSGGGKPCSWDTAAGTETRILYSNIATATNWSTSASVGAAETMMVFVK